MALNEKTNSFRSHMLGDWEWYDWSSECVGKLGCSELAPGLQGDSGCCLIEAEGAGAHAEAELE
ncbi:hypothetical protein EYF80_014858 [Liparis tanakae]|uniref:Uncharacterized protein n=1 Tax=Liparis tanakae TaxID=230148 RepID=A0A4Z2IAN2_9TELE|nr:hypothetical protein EYF80_014858 [Liparis tanakae]